MKRILSVVLPVFILLLCLAGCGQAEPVEAPPQNENAASSMTDVWQKGAWFHFSRMSAEHGEDYPIEWEDAGMERCVRNLLGRPEGEIRHSDVWEIRVLSVNQTNDGATGILLEELPEGYSEFSFESVFWNRDITQKFEIGKAPGFEKPFPPIHTLADLRHFDSLQLLSLDIGSEAKELTDISGLEQCKNLTVLELKGARPETLEPLAGAQSLDTLRLDRCGKVDLLPLADLPVLSRVFLNSDTIASLEPLANIPTLRFLCIGSDATYPSLSPLENSRIEYLDMGATPSGQKLYAGLDYTPLSRMPNLMFLNLTNHAIDAGTCGDILEASQSLKYLNISYTDAAKKSKQLPTQNLTILLDAK